VFFYNCKFFFPPENESKTKEKKATKEKEEDVVGGEKYILFSVCFFLKNSFERKK